MHTVIGLTIEQIIYRGKDIFTLILFDDKKNKIGINLLNCFSLEENGVIGNKIVDFSISPLNMKHIFYRTEIRVKFI